MRPRRDGAGVVCGGVAVGVGAVAVGGGVVVGCAGGAAGLGAVGVDVGDEVAQPATSRLASANVSAKNRSKSIRIPTV